MCVCVYVSLWSICNRTETDLRHLKEESHPSDSHPIRGAVSSLCSLETPVRWQTGSRENAVYIHIDVMFMYRGNSKQWARAAVVYLQSRTVHRPSEAMASDWHNETSSVMNNRRTNSEINYFFLFPFFPLSYNYYYHTQHG